MTPNEIELTIERRRLKRRLTVWRIAAVLGLVLAAIVWLGLGADLSGYRDHIARVRIDGLITGDTETLGLLRKISESDRVKAVIVRIDSPGGTTAGSEAIFDDLREIAKTRPVVAVMDTVAASGGYITAIAADRIIARGNTITGSIGVIFTFPEVSRLLDTLGIRMEEIKSGDLKAEPSPYRPVSPKARDVSNMLVQEGLDWFVGLVAERRGIPEATVRILADGRVYTGRQAVANKLIDELGDEDQALAWLSSAKNISSELEVVDWKPAPSLETGILGLSLSAALGRLLGFDAIADRVGRAKLDGLLALWHP
jgi:protease-4